MHMYIRIYTERVRV